MDDKFICIHGHFYQPPRENAWLEAVEIQDSAHPYHDWNERISAECYAANANSRILDEQGRISRIVNNYEKMSFNFGPTLLAWMETNAPGVYEAIQEADRNSVKRYAGHGSAMAQAYNHMILPLAESRDKFTQIYWGLEDFRRRFGRDPEGMWLPETAVDLESLAIMAELGVNFTVLTPYQAAKTRKIGEQQWTEVTGGAVDPKKPYLQKLPGGKEIAVFFYDGPISQAVAFEGLLKNGEKFGERLVKGFVDRDGPQLVHIATDGESYGHHSPFGDMALAYAMKYIEDQKLATLTNYGEYLENNPPADEVEIIEDTSWSCFHGVERWRGDCGCGSAEGRSQQWRRPLREAFDWLRDRLAPIYEKELGRFFQDPWKARNEYIAVIQDRSRGNVQNFIEQRAVNTVDADGRVRILKLLEIQRHAMLMYTSCGWFFEELTRIETVQVIQYAGRILQLCAEVFEEDLESPFLEKLAEAKSNVPALKDGKSVYENLIRPAMVDLKGVGSNYAISSLFEDLPDKSSIYCYNVDRLDSHAAEAGTARLGAGRVEITSEITLEPASLQFAVLYVGDHNLSCGVVQDRPGKNFEELIPALSDRFERAEFTEILRVFDQYFENSIYSLNSLLRDGQRKILERILESKVSDALAVYHRLYRQNIPLMRFLKGSSTPCPSAIFSAGKLALNGDLKEQFSRKVLDRETIMELLKEADLAGITLDADTLEYTIRKNLEKKARRFEENPDRLHLLHRINDSVDLIRQLPFEVNSRMVQDIFYDIAQIKIEEYRKRKQQGEKPAAEWIDAFEAVLEKLNVRTPENPDPDTGR